MAGSKPEDTHRLFAEAFNAGDLESLVALRAPDARLVPQPGQVVMGRAAIQEALRGFLALQGQLTVETTYVARPETLPSCARSGTSQAPAPMGSRSRWVGRPPKSSGSSLMEDGSISLIIPTVLINAALAHRQGRE